MQGLSTTISTHNQLVKSTDGSLSISVYKGELTGSGVAASVARLKASFPNLPLEFYKVLIDRIKEKGFTDEQLKDSVNHVIDNCIYPTPSLANFLSFNKAIKVYTYSELCNRAANQECNFSDYARIEIHGSGYWVKKSDKDIYSL